MNLDKFKSKLVIGLGNPGKEYSNTFHNAGFMFIDFLREQSQEQSTSEAQIINKKEYELTILPELDLKLLKPLTFMNNSGQVVAEFLKYNELEPEETIIAFDDLDIRFGEWKIQHDKYPKSHNGIISIHQATGKTNYNYLRIGVETRDDRRKLQQPGEDYVLSKLAKDQFNILEEVFEQILQDYDA